MSRGCGVPGRRSAGASLLPPPDAPEKETFPAGLSCQWRHGSERFAQKDDNVFLRKDINKTAQNHKTKRRKDIKTRLKLEPALGFEPRTDGLQNRSSTAELSRRVISRSRACPYFTVRRIRQEADSVRRDRLPPGKYGFRSRGMEPDRIPGRINMAYFFQKSNSPPFFFAFSWYSMLSECSARREPKPKWKRWKGCPAIYVSTLADDRRRALDLPQA